MSMGIQLVEFYKQSIQINESEFKVFHVFHEFYHLYLVPEMELLLHNQFSFLLNVTNLCSLSEWKRNHDKIKE